MTDKKRAALQAALEAMEYLESQPHVRGKGDCYEDLIAEIRAALDEDEDVQLRADARRYRWLRDKADSLTVCDCTSDGEWIPLRPNNIDSAIDAAMEADRD